MNPRKLLELNRAALGTKLTARTQATEALNALRARVDSGDATVTDQNITDAVAARSSIDAEIDALESAATELRAEIARDEAMERLAGETVPGSGAVPVNPADLNGYTPAGQRNQSVARAVVTSEPRTYSHRSNLYPDQHGEKVSFFADAYKARTGNAQAQERMARHQREVEVDAQTERDSGGQTQRASTTTTFGSLVVPQYLVDMVAPLLRAGRPIANICNGHELPDRGMALIIPRITTGTATAVQATQNTAVQNTDPAVTDLTVPVVTVAGQVDVSRQTLERGENVDYLLYGDLARAHAVNVDVQVINGSGTAGQALGILNTSGASQATAYTAAATAASYNLKKAGQIAAVSSQGAGLIPRLIAMHPTRWAWLTGQLDSANRPIVVANTIANFNALAVITKPGQISADSDPINGGQFVGIDNSGLPVLTDLNIPTAVGTGPEDIVIIGDNSEWHLWEEGNGLPRELKFEETLAGQLTTKLVVYSYIAFTAGRYPGATGKMGGNAGTAGFGQVAPVF